MRAFALMRSASDLEAAYVASPFFESARTHLEALRRRLPLVRFSSYRGIGRYPIAEQDQGEPGWQWAGNVPSETEADARSVLRRILSPGDDDLVTPYPRAFLARLEDAQEVHSALLEPERYEIVELCAPPDRPRALLGFDIGYWGGGNFSILCDAAIWPLWHPPPAGSFSELSKLSSRLNRHALFPSPRAAIRYLEWYARQFWAETEPSEFILVGVGTCNP